MARRIGGRVAGRRGSAKRERATASAGRRAAARGARAATAARTRAPRAGEVVRVVLARVLGAHSADVHRPGFVTPELPDPPPSEALDRSYGTRWRVEHLEQDLAGA